MKVPFKRIFFGILFLFILLFSFVYGILRVPYIQNLVISEVTTYLSQKTNSEVSIGYISLKFPKSLSIENVDIKTPLGDHLLTTEEILVDVDIETLSLKNIILDQVYINGLDARLQLNKEGRYNFEYFVDAFAADSTKKIEKDTTNKEKPLLVFNDVHISKSKVFLGDSVHNHNIYITADYIRTDVPSIDLNKNIYTVNSIEVENSNVRYEQYGTHILKVDTLKKVVDEEKAKFQLYLTKGIIKNSYFEYNDRSIKQKLYAGLGLFEIRKNHIDLGESLISNDFISFDKSKFEYSFTSDTANIKPYKKPTLETLTTLDIGWDVTTKHLDFKNFEIEYNDNLFPRMEKGIDQNHVLFSNINTIFEDIVVNDNEMLVSIDKFNFKEKNGIDLHHLKTDITVKPNEMSINNLLLEVNNSFIKNDLYLKYPNLYQMGDYPSKITIDDKLGKAHLALKDILLFAPELESDTLIGPFLDYNVEMSTSLIGDLTEMHLSNSTLSSDIGFKSEFDLSVSNIMEIDSIVYDVNLDSIDFSTNKLAYLLLDSSITNTYDIPQTIKGHVKAHGDLNNTYASTALNFSKEGSLALTFEMHNQNNYALALQTKDLEVGQILKDSTIGRVSTNLTFQGSGLDIEKDLQAVLEFELTKGEYQKYDYTGIKMYAELDRKSVIWKASADKKGLKFNLAGSVNMNKKIPTATLNGNVKNIDLYKLNIYEDTLSFGLDITSNTTGFDLIDLNSTLDLENIYFLKDRERHDIKFFKSHVELDSSHFFVNLDTEALEGRVKSDVTLDSISNLLESYFSQFFSSREMIGQRPPSSGVLDGYLKIKKTDKLLDGTIPGLDSLKFEECDFKFDASTNTFDFDLLIPKITYQNYDFDTIFVDLHANSEKLKYDIGFNQFHVIGYEDYSLHYWSLLGDASDNHLNFKTEGFDVAKKDIWLYVGGRVDLDSITYNLKFDDYIIVNKEKWSVDKENYVLLNGGLPEIHNLFVEKDEQAFKIETLINQQEADTLITLQINKFSLDSTTYNVKTDTSIVNGEINALVKVGDIREGGKLSADLSVDNFGFFNTILADITSKSSNTEDIHTYKNETKIEGKIGKIISNSTYDVSDSIAPLDLKLSINNLLLEPFEVFSKDYATELSGSFGGHIDFQGLGSAPIKVDGEVLLESPAFKVNMLNVHLTGTKGKIRFDNHGIHFLNIGFKDKENRLAALSGDIETKDYLNYNFNLKFSADDITIVNSTEKDNEEYYGKLIIGNVTKVTGPLSHLMIKSDIRISRGTDMTYVYVDGGVGDVDTGNDIVHFVDEKDTVKVISTTNNYELNATINIDEQSKFKVIIDPRAGDALTLVGGGSLNLRMDSGDDIVMSGQYVITEGDYSMTFYQLMNKKLKLEKGSSVLWTGDPYNPQADMTAIYEASASPYPLVANQIEPAQANKYKSKRKFIVYMNMNGDVIKPELSFKLEYPGSSQGGDQIETAVDYLNQDESQLNKQVFSFLVLGTFLNDSGSEGYSTSDMVAGSVSSIISQQLNNVTDGLTNGFVDVNFDLDTYSQNQGASTTNRTDVGVTLKKTLFNERLSVSVGGKMAVSGNQADENNSSSFNTDFLLEYNLLTDGTLKNRLFRSIDDQYFTPDVFKTGVSIMFTKEYNQGKELFIRNLDKKKDIRKRMGMMKRAGSSGGMMQSSDSSNASTGMMAPSEDKETDSIKIKSDSLIINTDSTQIKSDVEGTKKSSTLPSEDQSSNSDYFFNLFLRSEDEFSIKTLAKNEK